MKIKFNLIKSKSVKEMKNEYIWLSQYSKSYKKDIFLYLIIGILSTAYSLIASIISKKIIDNVTGSHTDSILVALIFFVLMQLLQILMQAISSRINAKVSIKVNQEITAKVYDKLLATDWEALSSYHSGDLLTRITGDVSTISSSVIGWFPELFTRLLQFGGTLCLILYYDPTLALLALISAPATVLMSRYFIKMMREHNQTMRQISSKMMVFNEETFQNIQLIKSFNRTDAYSERHKALQNEYKETTLRYNKFSIEKRLMTSLIGTIVAVLCFAWSIYRLRSGAITYGTMALFLNLSTALSSGFSALTGLIPVAINAATSAGRIMAIMDLPLENKCNEEAAKNFIEKNKNSSLSIKADNLSYRYENGVSVLSNVNFEAKGGEIVAIIGPSGEGKTTLLRLLLGIVHQQNGSLMLYSPDGDKIDISPCTRTLFAYVPQDNTVFSGTIKENLTMTNPNATDDEIYESLKIACADEFVNNLPQKIDTLIKEQGKGFSEGQIQRLCIARALLTKSPILLMDETTSALDMETENKVLQNIINSQSNRTCIITTHRPSVLNISNRIYKIYNDSLEQYQNK
ncbi:MAG: ABC transporter ATP-binding protein [Clostridia bacterium]|nr:ABC transporter ATP-binding protein [Clostridia bacterium]